MADLTAAFNTLLQLLTEFQTSGVTLARLQVFFGAVTILLTAPFLNDSTVKYKDDAAEVLSASKIYQEFQ